MKRMNAEFAEMLQTTTGRLLDQITVSSLNSQYFSVFWVHLCYARWTLMRRFLSVTGPKLLEKNSYLKNRYIFSHQNLVRYTIFFA